MPYYSEDLVEEIRSRNDIVDVISSYVKLQKKGSAYFGLCPFHNERSPSFSVSPNKQMYYCFGCGAGGNVFTFLMEYENLGFLEALDVLAERSGIELPKQELSEKARQEADSKSRILEVNKEAAKYFYAQLRREQGESALAYLERRRLTPDTMRKFGLGYANLYSDDLYQYLRQQGYEDTLLQESGLVKIDEVKGGRDRFWNRVIFPIMDVNHRAIGFGGRVMGEGEPKYLNSPETKIFDKSRNLYGLNFARASRRPQILLCEGYMDVIALHQAGFDNAVASLGTAFTAGHANLLKRYAKDVYLAFDSDEAGVRAAVRAIPLLKEAGLAAKIVDMKPHKDPDEFIQALGVEAFQERIDRAQNSFLFELSVMERSYDLADPEEKTAFHNEIARRLLEFEEELERENYIEAVAQTYHIGFAHLRELVHHIGVRGDVIRERKPLKSGIRDTQANGREEGMRQSQKLLLTWLMQDPALFQRIEPYLGPEDFTESLYREVALALFTQNAQGKINPAKIISMFPEEEKQREIASLFHAKINELQTREEEEKALKETILRIKKNSIDIRAGKLEPTDMGGLQRLLADKKQLEALQKAKLK